MKAQCRIVWSFERFLCGGFTIYLKKKASGVCGSIAVFCERYTTVANWVHDNCIWTKDEEEVEKKSK